MTTISFEFEPSAFGALRLAPNEFAREMRIAAAVQWYAQGVVSQGKAAELAGLTRADFLDELHQRKVPPARSRRRNWRTRSMAPKRWVVNA